MYRTIEAEIRDGRVIGAEASSLPSRARVLITLLCVHPDKKRPAFGTKTSQKVQISPGALDPLTDDELSDWGL